MDTKIKILILCFLSAFGLYGQTPNINFAAKFQITSATGGDPYNIVGIVSDDLSRFTGSDVQINDSIYVIDGSDVYVLAVTSITSVVGPTVTLVANDPLDAGVSIPTGQAAIIRPTPNYNLPTYISGLRDDLRSMIMNRQAQLIDDITGGGTPSITDFTSAGIGVPPSALASSNGGETWRNMTTGELWRSDGSRWYSFTYSGKECQDTVTVSLITVQSGGSVTTGSPLIRNSSGVWEHMYNHPSGLNLIPDGVVTDVITGPRAIIQYCGVRKGSGATPNTSYYVNQSANSGFTTTKPTTNIRPLGKVASNGDFLINAGLLFSRDNLQNAVDSTFAKTNGTYPNKRISDNVYKNGTLGLRTTDTLGVLDISNGNSASAKIAVLIKQGGPFLSKIEKDILSDSYATGDFYTGRSYSDSASTAGENQVFNAGINYSPGGGHVKRYANAMGWAYESNFKNAPSEKGEPGFGNYEAHVLEVVYSDSVQGSDGVKRSTGVPDNTKRRMLEGYISNQKPSYGGYLSLCTDQIPIVDWKTGTSKAVWTFAENMPNNKGITFIDTASIVFRKNNVGGLFFLNATNTTTLGVLKVDNLNRMVLGFSGISTLYTEGQNFNSIGPLTIAPLASQPLTLGSTLTTANVDIKGLAAVPLVLYSAVATNGMGFKLSNSDLSLRDMGTNNDVIRFDRGSPALSIWIRNTSGNVGIGAYPDSDISLHVKKTALGATSKLFGIENSTGKNSFFRTNATPESTITGSQGDLALTNISSVGGLWLKKTGTGNTGWEQAVTTSGTSGSVSTLMREESFTATASQTAFTITYSAPAVSGTSVPLRVYRNGVRLFYVASGPTTTQFTYSGTSVTTAANTVGEIITIEYLN